MLNEEDGNVDKVQRSRVQGERKEQANEKTRTCQAPPRHCHRERNLAHHSFPFPFLSFPFPNQTKPLVKLCQRTHPCILSNCMRTSFFSTPCPLPLLLPHHYPTTTLPLPSSPSSTATSHKPARSAPHSPPRPLHPDYPHSLPFLFIMRWLDFVTPLTITYLVVLILSFFFTDTPIPYLILNFVIFSLAYVIPYSALPTEPRKLRSFTTLAAFVVPPAEFIVTIGLSFILAIPAILVEGKNAINDNYRTLIRSPAFVQRLFRKSMVMQPKTFGLLSIIYLIVFILVLTIIPVVTYWILGYPHKFISEDRSVWTISNILLLGLSAYAAVLVGSQIYELAISIIVSIYYSDVKVDMEGDQAPSLLMDLLVLIPALCFELSGQLFVSMGIAKKYCFYIGNIYTTLVYVWLVKVIVTITLSCLAVSVYNEKLFFALVSVVFLICVLAAWFIWCVKLYFELRELESNNGETAPLTSA